jgi:hypothetical protein
VAVAIAVTVEEPAAIFADWNPADHRVNRGDQEPGRRRLGANQGATARPWTDARDMPLPVARYETVIHATGVVDFAVEDNDIRAILAASFLSDDRTRADQINDSS